MMMLFLKTSFFVLYLDIFAQLRWAVICSWIGIFATVITHSVFFIYTLVGASPNHGGWATSMTKQVSTPYSIVGLILDLTILIIPILVISRLNMGWQRRVARMTVFCSGGLACVCSCLSIYFRIVQTNGQNHTWQSVWPTILVLVEVFIGIVCACAPAAVHASNHPNSVFRKLPEHYRAFGSRPSTKESNPANPLVHDEPSSLVAVEGLRSTDQKYAPYFELNDRVDGKPRGVKDLGVLPSKPFDELVQKPPATFYRRDAQPTSHPDTEKQ
ncbi:hypothetical protein BDV95DRAFT_129638 [Massariosphaeria phaeospora]|uniref:Rhodopsin domain-containing protein n=1 Tax=Massariosphaeria phaeospora TaxID=100035 RepID=A0A7C8M4H5_9PLEO|nr:hypothetical protein BDV95DRAFT_129638 [Massariosphaeria phaeospora]